MNLDLNSPVPIFQQIVDGLCTSLAAGVYRAGEFVPSVRQQALKLLVNPNTVQRAYEHLEREGLLISRRGNGMEVAPDAAVLALRRSTHSVRTAFMSGILLGCSAHLERKAIDDLYKNAWVEAQNNPGDKR